MILPSIAEPGYLAERFRLLIASLSDYAVFMIDLSGIIRSWNPGVERLLGYNESEFIGLDVSSLFMPEDIARGRPAQELARALADGRSDDTRDHVRKNGTRFRADGVVAVIRDDAGVAHGFSKVMHDVTAQQEATDALRESEERYRLLVESVRDYAIFLLDASGCVASWTPAAERMMAYSQDEILGQHNRVFFTSEDQQNQLAEHELRNAELTGRAEGEGWRVRKDGSRFWGDEIVSSIRDESGNLHGFAKVVRDLTERQRTALEREQLYARAQEANRLKDEFLGTISHELRTPLNAILGWIRLLDIEAMKLDETRRRHALMIIRRNAEIQAQLVDDLLDVSRIISGKMQLEVRVIKASEVLKAAFEAERSAAEAKGVELHLHLDPGGDTIVADPNRLQQIVWNLLSNAIKFTSSGGRVDLYARQSASGADIIVEDTGIGIPPEVLPFVFDRFRQADSSTARRHGGVGLGLAIVRHLVELHGGSVEADSEGIGKGTTITVHLPIAGALARRAVAMKPDQWPKTPADSLPHLERVRVLLVDDDPDTREVLIAVLGTTGAEVSAAESSEQALALIAERSPDVIIADISRPGEDGYAFIRKARQMLSGQEHQPPAIALTACAGVEDRDRDRALRAGYQRHVSKPFDPHALVRSVKDLVA
jgi:PAS domain S-box-containing protein